MCVRQRGQAESLLLKKHNYMAEETTTTLTFAFVFFFLEALILGATKVASAVWTSDTAVSVRVVVVSSAI